MSTSADTESELQHGMSFGVPVKAGELFRGDSHISDDCVFKRWGILYNDGLVTKRGGEHGVSSKKVWPLSGDCCVSPASEIEERTVRLLKSSYTVISLLYKSSKQRMHCFWITWPAYSIFAHSHDKSLLLAFKDSAVAHAWHDAFTAVIANLRALPPDLLSIRQITESQLRRDMRDRSTQDTLPPSPSAGARVGKVVRKDSVMMSSSESAEAEVAEGPGSLASPIDTDGSWAHVPSVPAAPSAFAQLGAHGAACSSAGQQPPRVVQRLNSGFHKSHSGDLHGNLRVDGSTSLTQHWGKYHVVNGLLIFKQETGHELGSMSAHMQSYMVSHRIRGSPKQVVQHLTTLQEGSSCLWAFSSIGGVKSRKDLERVTMFKATMQPPAGTWLRGCVRPRDVFLQRCVRYDDDGACIVLFQSVDKRLGGFELTPGHVEATIASMGFTIAPLKPELWSVHDNSSASPESLVTLVLSVNFGGWLDGASIFRRLMGDWERAWTEALLMTVIALENHVDQGCFVRGEEDIVDAFTHADLFPTAPELSNNAAACAASMVRGASCATSALCESADLSSASGPIGPSAMARQPTASQLKAETSQFGGPGARAGADGEAVDTWLDRKYWSCPGTAGFKVRGASYLKDRKKVPSEEPVFRLVGVELMKMNEPTYHVSRFLPVVRRSTAPFNFVLCFTLPWNGRILALALVYEADIDVNGSRGGGSDDGDDEALSPFDLTMARFLADKGPLRDAKIKLIPSLAKGSWIVRQAVGQTPVMLGKRLKTEYFMEEGYFEADVDISANSTAAQITSMVAGAIKSLVFDIGVLLEGHSNDELPERLLGTARLNYLDLAAAVELDTSKEIPQATRRRPHFDA